MRDVDEFRLEPGLVLGTNCCRAELRAAGVHMYARVFGVINPLTHTHTHVHQVDAAMASRSLGNDFGSL